MAPRSSGVSPEELSAFRRDMRRLKWAGAMLVLVSVLYVPWGYAVAHEFFRSMAPPGSEPKEISHIHRGPWKYLGHRFILDGRDERWCGAQAAGSYESYMAGLYSAVFYEDVGRNWILYGVQIAGALLMALALLEWKKDQLKGMERSRPSQLTRNPLRPSS
jgi:hypothetical protein